MYKGNIQFVISRSLMILQKSSEFNHSELLEALFYDSEGKGKNKERSDANYQLQLKITVPYSLKVFGSWGSCH